LIPLVAADAQLSGGDLKELTYWKTTMTSDGDECQYLITLQHVSGKKIPLTNLMEEA